MMCIYYRRMSKSWNAGFGSTSSCPNWVFLMSDAGLPVSFSHTFISWTASCTQHSIHLIDFVCSGEVRRMTCRESLDTIFDVRPMWLLRNVAQGHRYKRARQQSAQNIGTSKSGGAFYM